MIRLRALGLDADALAMAERGFGVPDLIAFRAAGVPLELIESIDATLLPTISAPELVLLYSCGCDAEAVNQLRRLGFSVSEIIGLASAQVPISYITAAVDCSGRLLTAAEVIRLHCAKVDVSYLSASMRGCLEASVDESIRLWSVGISAEFIEQVGAVLPGRCTAAEMTRLWLTGMDIPLLQRMSSSL